MNGYYGKQVKRVKEDEWNLDCMVFKERVIESWLFRNMNAVDYVPIWTLFVNKEQKLIKTSH